MVEWVLTVASIAIIVLLCDVILPEGQTRKYIKTVLGVVVTFVIVQPIAGLFAADLDVVQGANADMSVQEQYIENIEHRQDNQKSFNLKLTLESNGLECEKVEVSSINRSVTVCLGEAYSDTQEEKVNSIAKRFFSSYKIIIRWK